MPAVGTGPDLLVAHLSGAAADGDAQPDPAASLGGHRSAARAAGLGVLMSSPVAGVRVDWASPGNGPGGGSLTAVSDDELTWAPPGAAAGGPVALAHGAQAVLSGPDPNAYLIVTRTSADPMAGAAGVTLARSFNDLFGQADVDVSTPTAPTYRLLVLRNAGGGEVRDLKVWVGPSTHRARVGLELPASQPTGGYQAVADALAPPAGVAFVRPTSAGHPHALAVARLGPGEHAGVWVERWPVSAAGLLGLTEADLYAMTAAEYAALAAAAPPPAAAARADLGLAWSFTAVG